MKTYLSGIKFACITVLMVLLASCGGGGGHGDSDSDIDNHSDNEGPVITPPETHAVPVISSILPATLVVGQPAKISGSHLEDAGITYNGAAIEPTLRTAHELNFIVPENSQGSFQLKLENADGAVTLDVPLDLPLHNVTQVSTAPGTSCAVLVSGDVECWGDGAPALVDGVSNVKSMSAGYGHNCALLRSGDVRCWGKPWIITQFETEVGPIPYNSAPTNIPGISNAVAVSLNDSATICVLLADGTVRCWGYPIMSNVPVKVKGISNATSISAGPSQACATLADGRVVCWPLESTFDTNTLTTQTDPVVIAGISDAIGVAVNADACALLSGGGVRCWGRNSYGELGNGTKIDSATPVDVSGITTATAISAGGARNCALLQGGEIRCWGSLSYGGNYYSALDSVVPVTVSGISNATAVSSSQDHNCALTVSGQVYCWGAGGLGIGNTGMFSWHAPVTVSDISNAVDLDITASLGCVTTKAGVVRCWGSRPVVGDGVTPIVSPPSNESPFDIADISSAISAVISDVGCALLSSGEVRCWGGNVSGQLGDGTTNNSESPVAVSGISNAIKIDAGGSSLASINCAVLASGELRCWGESYPGLGDGVSQQSSIPVAVSGISNAVDVSIGSHHNCVVLATGEVQCWGYSEYGEMGANPDRSSTPVVVAGASNAIAVSAAEESTCALLKSGEVQCWGWIRYGELGELASENYSLSPVTVSGISGAVSIASGNHHHCAALATGAVRCWGENGAGQLGDNTTTDSSAAVTVVGIDNAIAVSASEDRSCALLKDGYVQCWGLSANANDVLYNPAVPVHY